MKRKIYNIAMNFLLRRKSVQKSNLLAMEFKTVCFFSNTALGDTLFNTPVFRVLKENFPKVKTIAVLNPSSASLFKTDPNIDDVVLYNGRWKGFFRAIRQLKQKNIDVVFILHSNEPQATPLAVLSGAQYIFKLPNLKNEFNKFHSNSPIGISDNCYVVLNRLQHLKFIGVDSIDTRMQVFLNTNDYVKIDNILQKKNDEILIGFQVGASSIARLWLISRWIELAELLLDHKKIKIILTGNKKERELTSNVEIAINSDRVLNLAGLFSIREAAALISRLDVLITPDTGPLHLAIATRTSTISLFGVANPVTSLPDYDQHLHKFIKIDYSGVVDKHKDYSRLMSKISAKNVYDKILGLLKNKLK